MKKVISIILAVAMVLSLLTAASFAEGGMAYPEKENLAFEKDVETWDMGGANDNLSIPDWFNKENLTDGRLDAFDLNPSNTAQSLAWYTCSSNQDTEITATVNLEDEYRIGEVYLYPTKFLDGNPTPAIFEVELSLDGDEFWVIGGEEELPYATYSDPFIYDGGGATAAYVRIHIWKESPVFAEGVYYGGFGELEVYEYEEESSGGEARSFDADLGDKLSFDKIYLNGVEAADGNGPVIALKKGIDGTKGDISQISLYGWYGNLNSETVAFGYRINGEEIVFGDFFFDTESEVTNLGANNRRFVIPIDVSSYTGPGHEIWIYAKLQNGDVVKLDRFDNRGQDNEKDREIYVIYNGPNTSSAILGDVDGDGELSDWDAITFERYLAGWNVEYSIDAMDIDGDEDISDWDAILLARYLAGWNVEYFN